MLSKSQARAFFLGGTGLFTAIFLVLTVDSMIRVPEQTNQDQLTPQVVAGKEIWEANNCMGCHTLFGEGAYYAPELTKVVERRGIPWIKVFLKDPQAMFPGQRKMVQYDFTDQQVDEVIAFLDWAGKVDLNGFPAKPPLREALQAVAPAAAAAAAPAAQPVPDVFVTGSCLGCHLLQGQGGAAGAAMGAPALDDVYLRKSRDELVAWIENPQKVKPGTLMPSLVGVAVTPAQVQEIADYLIGLDPKRGSTPPS
jgi:nitric oxide reductase subunit C